MILEEETARTARRQRSNQKGQITILHEYRLLRDMNLAYTCRLRMMSVWLELAGPKIAIIEKKEITHPFLYYFVPLSVSNVEMKTSSTLTLSYNGSVYPLPMLIVISIMTSLNAPMGA